MKLMSLMRLFLLYSFLLCLGFNVQAKKLELIVDTDAGIDDIIAITYLMKNPDV